MELCSGCFAYLEFPPLVDADAADVRQDVSAPIAAGLENPTTEAALDQVAAVKR
jgi:hypothetical protein